MSQPFDRFTERAKKVLVLAQEEARRFDHNYVGTEHLLIAVVAESVGDGARMLAGVGVDLPRLREALSVMVGRGDQDTTGQTISLTPRAKRVIELANEASRALGQFHVGSVHLLLGLIDTRDLAVRRGVSVGVLQRLGVDLEGLRAATVAYIASETERLRSVPSTGTIVPIAGAKPRDNVVTCRVDDATYDAIEALVEAGVHNTRSEAAARLMLAGTQANRPFLKCAYQAVAEIRRVRAEALARMWGSGETGET